DAVVEEASSRPRQLEREKAGPRDHEPALERVLAQENGGDSRDAPERLRRGRLVALEDAKPAGRPVFAGGSFETEHRKDSTGLFARSSFRDRRDHATERRDVPALALPDGDDGRQAAARREKLARGVLHPADLERPVGDGDVLAQE